MSLLENLTILDGYIDADRFICRGITEHAVYATHSAESLRSFARVIGEGEAFNLIIDEDKTIKLTAAQATQLRQELFTLADELEAVE
jgi:hypothetical protein